MLLNGLNRNQIVKIVATTIIYVQLWWNPNTVKGLKVKTYGFLSKANAIEWLFYHRIP